MEENNDKTKKVRDSRRDFLGKILSPILATSSIPLVAAKEKKDFKAFFSPVRGEFKLNKRLRVGIVGLGGRGTGAVNNILSADKNIELIAIGEVEGVNIGPRLSSLIKKYKSRVQVKKGGVFFGFDSYKKVIDSGVDIVLLTTPPCFRYKHIEYAVEKNVHIFSEKPIAIDGPSLRSVIKSVRLAKKKKLSFLTGFVWRYTKSAQSMYETLFSGKIGEVLTANSYYNAGGRPKSVGYLKDFDYQYKYADKFLPYLKKWSNFLELGGDSILEQAIHSIDKLSWAMRDEKPKSCVANGGQAQPYKGNTFDHFSVEYSFSKNKTAFLKSSQLPRCHRGIYDEIIAAGGRASLTSNTGTVYNSKGEIISKEKAGLGYTHEHKILVSHIRAGKVFSDMDSVINSTGMAIMGRMAAYTGDLISWDDMLESKEILFDADQIKSHQVPYKVRPVAIPGLTKYV